MTALPRVAGPALAAMALAISAPAHAITPDAPDRAPLRTCTPAPDADCSHADLRFLDLVGKDLRNASFRGADLSRADLRGANLVGADFTDAVAVGTDFSKSYLATAIFVRTDLTGALMASARMSKSDFSGAHLFGADVSGAWAIGCNFAGATLRNVDAQETKFSASNFDGAVMYGTRIRFALFDQVAFGSCRGCPTDW